MNSKITLEIAKRKTVKILKSNYIYKISVLFFIFTLCNYAFSQEPLPSSKNLGLVSYLTTVKSVAEFKIFSLSSDEQYNTEVDKTKKFQSEYNLLKLTIDRLINQLEVDLIATNKLKKYKRLDKFIKGEISKLPKKMKAYESVLKEIESKLETFLFRDYHESSSTKGLPGLSEIFGFAELTHGVITDARDFRAKKVIGINVKLSELKLKSIKELTLEEKKKD